MKRLLLVLVALFGGAVFGVEGTAMRVMSFNIRYGTAKDGENHWEKRKDLCVSRIAAFDPDLLGLQEVLDFQNAYILEKTGAYAALGVAREDGKLKGEFSTILYRKERFDVIESGTFWLSETPDVAGSKSWDSSLPRIATWARLKDKQAGGRELLYINTHFDHRGPLARLEAAKMLRTFATEKGKDLPVVLTGDFNSGPDSEPYKALLSDMADRIAFQDSYRLMHAANPEPSEGTAHAFKDAPVTPRIDWILFSKQFTVESAAIDRTRQGPLFPSDHFAVIATARLP
jgi:endonuclease/exonuclease/phosphatase family metal-dependent hydrolase